MSILNKVGNSYSIEDIRSGVRILHEKETTSYTAGKLK